MRETASLNDAETERYGLSVSIIGVAESGEAHLDFDLSEPAPQPNVDKPTPRAHPGGTSSSPSTYIAAEAEKTVQMTTGCAYDELSGRSREWPDLTIITTARRTHSELPLMAHDGKCARLKMEAPPLAAKHAARAGETDGGLRQRFLSVLPVDSL